MRWVRVPANVDIVVPGTGSPRLIVKGQGVGALQGPTRLSPAAMNEVGRGHGSAPRRSVLLRNGMAAGVLRRRWRRRGGGCTWGRDACCAAGDVGGGVVGRRLVNQTQALGANDGRCGVLQSLSNQLLWDNRHLPRHSHSREIKTHRLRNHRYAEDGGNTIVSWSIKHQNKTALSRETPRSLQITCMQRRSTQTSK